MNRVERELLLNDISLGDIIEIINSLPNKGSGPNHIPLKMLLPVAGLIAPPLCHIVNVSFRADVFPHVLRIAGWFRFTGVVPLWT